MGAQIAEQVGNENPYRVQHLLGRAQWDAEELCQEVRQYGIEGLSEPGDIFAVDETGFLKQGNQSVGVQVQYYGTTGHERKLPGWRIFVLHHGQGSYPD